MLRAVLVVDAGGGCQADMGLDSHVSSMNVVNVHAADVTAGQTSPHSGCLKMNGAAEADLERVSKTIWTLGKTSGDFCPAVGQ